MLIIIIIIIFISREWNKNIINHKQINKIYIRKAAREAQNSLTGRLCNYWMFGGNNMEG